VKDILLVGRLDHTYMAYIIDEEATSVSLCSGEDCALRSPKLFEVCRERGVRFQSVFNATKHGKTWLELDGTSG